jgi:glycosyltransferase involved in cell wall biosynthesis
MKTPSVLGIVSYRIFPAEMGGQKAIADLYDSLAGFTQVTLVVSRENKDTGSDRSDRSQRPDRSDPVPVFPFLYNHWKAPLNILYLRRVQKLIKQRGIDVIIAEHSYLGFFLLLLRWLTKKPVCIRSHNIESHRFRDMGRIWWPLYTWYEKRMHRRMDHSFFITEEDKSWAISHWKLDPEKCSVLTYGTSATAPIPLAQRIGAREQLLATYRLPAGTRLFLFNGSFDYLPNTDALRIILTELLPLLKPSLIPFRIIICGKGLDKSWEKVLLDNPAILYAGFVKDIDLYLRGADCFISPVTLGSGIRIKMVDALAANQPMIACKSAAKGIPAEITGSKMVLIDDYDWQAFARAMLSLDPSVKNDTPEAFYTHFNQERIVTDALLSLQAL